MKSSTFTPPKMEGIAVIGMQGRFPGARDVSELWRNLREGIETISTFSEADLRAAGVDPAFLNVPGFISRGCVLDGIDQFDAGFFGYSARDAETMDPQQRMFLECAWETFELAGYDPETFPGMVGVFAGSDQSSYLYQIYSNVDLSAYGYGGMMAIGNEKDYLATQVSYKLNLRGPSMAIQTSCSTSLVAVCMACQNLAHGYCDMALAGGVGIGVPQRKGYWYQPGGIVSPDGHCRPFDVNGQGTVVGNGLGMVLLKRLPEAIADGDNILAVIKGFALNNDGSAKVGYTAPSIEGQSQAIRMAQRMAGVEPDSIGYVEAHGTATALGDPVEVAALTKAFRERTARRQFCAIGSIKSNVGHLSSAAGIAGLIKGVLVVNSGEIPKSLHYTSPNPQIELEKSPFYVAGDHITEWPIKDQPRRAAVSAFGVGGTNAHMILEEPPRAAVEREAPEKQLLVISARSSAALERATTNLIGHLESHPELDLADVAFTLQAGRKAFPHRRTMVFDRGDRAGLVNSLRSNDPLRVSTATTESRDRAVVFMFSGQGTQYVDMGLELYRTEKTFRDHVDTCCAILKSEIGFDLRDVLYPERDREAAAERLKQTSITQPALFTIEYSLARLWMSWGLTPKAMLGHSIGEYTAACLAGVMDLQEALSVVAMRGRLMDSMPGGSMLAVPMSEAAVKPMLTPAVSLAAVNAPSICVLSGTATAIAALEKQLSAQGLPCRRLHTSHAFHSSMMEPVMAQFVDRLRRVKLRAPQIAFLSNVTGGWIRPEQAVSPEYWGAHLLKTVRFADNLRELMVFPDLAMLEVGPGQTLGLLARQQGSRVNSQLVVASLRAAQEEACSDAEFIRQTVGKLWLGGVRIDWRGFHEHEHRRTVVLPTYPFDRQRFWLGPLEQQATAAVAEAETAAVPASRPPALAQPAMALDGSFIAAAVPSAAASRDIADWFYTPAWRQAAAEPSTASGGTSWLIFQDSLGVGARAARELAAQGISVNTVLPGDEFSSSAGTEFRIRAGERADYLALVRALAERQELPDRILHLWSLDGGDTAQEGSPLAAFDAAQTRSFYSLAYLAQALGKAGGSSPVQIGVVTESLQPVVGDENLRADEATVSGACKVIPQEYPHLRCRQIDVVASQHLPAAALLAELDAAPFEPVVAFRNGRRWIQTFDAVRLGTPKKPSSLLRRDAVYLITGGLGNIGLLLAEAIAASVPGKLVLTGRSSFPARGEWERFVAAHPQEQTSARIRRLLAIEKSGSEICILQADSTNAGQMRTAFEFVREQFGPIHGVIHGTANLSPDAFGPVRNLDPVSGGAHFRPKAHALLILEELLKEQEQPPAFVLMLSSLSAVLGGLGLAAYAASNAYLDAEAHRRNLEGATAWITVDWDAWDFSPDIGTRTGVISGPQGQEALRRILTSSLRQIVVAAEPLPARYAQWVRFEIPVRSPQPAQVVGAAPATVNGAAHAGEVHKRPELSTQLISPRSETERQIAAVWEHLLGVAPIGVYDKFFELGGHSLLAIQLLARLREIFDVDLPVQRIFEAPTVAQLAEVIEKDKPISALAASMLTQSVTNGAPADDVMKLVEGLSEAELDALLDEAEALEKGASAND